MIFPHKVWIALWEPGRTRYVRSTYALYARKTFNLTSSMGGFLLWSRGSEECFSLKIIPIIFKHNIVSFNKINITVSVFYLNEMLEMASDF